MLTSYRTRFDNIQAAWKHPYAACGGVCPSPQLSSSVGAAFLLQELMREKEKNKVLQAQVASLESIVEDLRNQAEQYNSEAISSEVRIHELESELEESQRREAGLISADRLEAAIEKVAELEELLQVQTEKGLAKAPEEEVAHLVVENVALRERLHVTETMLSNAKVPLSDQVPDEELAFALVEAAVCREKVADPYVHSPARSSESSTSPCSELAAALIEASQLRSELAELRDANPIHAAISSFKKEAFEAVECTRQEIERIRILHSSSPVETLSESLSTVSPPVSSPEWASSSRSDLDDDLAYALIENYNLRQMLNSTSN